MSPRLATMPGLPPLLACLGLLVLWEVAARTFDISGLPPAHEALRALPASVGDPEGRVIIAQSIRRMGVGFGLGRALDVVPMIRALGIRTVKRLVAGLVARTPTERDVPMEREVAVQIDAGLREGILLAARTVDDVEILALVDLLEVGFRRVPDPHPTADPSTGGLP